MKMGSSEDSSSTSQAAASKYGACRKDAKNGGSCAWGIHNSIIKTIHRSRVRGL
jgi:hypothetical protein